MQQFSYSRPLLLELRQLLEMREMIIDHFIQLIIHIHILLHDHGVSLAVLSAPLVCIGRLVAHGKCSHHDHSNDHGARRKERGAAG